MNPFDALARDQYRVGDCRYNRVRREDVRSHEILQGGDESLIGAKLLVPEPVLRAETGGHIDFVYGREVASPRVAPGHRRGVVGEMQWQFRILKIAQPVRHAEMH